MLSDLLCEAVNQRRIVTFFYDELPRVVEPHAVGLTRAGKIVLRGFQCAGTSNTEAEAWKLFDLAKMEQFGSGPAAGFSGPRPGYKVGDRAMTQIFAELDPVYA